MLSIVTNPAPEAPSQYQVRPGDPLISLGAPQDSRQVIAILPDGAVKPLGWNALTSKWETRFDVPTYAPDGVYIVQILLVRADGSRKRAIRQRDDPAVGCAARRVGGCASRSIGAFARFRSSRSRSHAEYEYCLRR